ncbi:uncharacterized protein JCM6883_001768 [Sporobolomyces salmoneus]|uniref:uncharacterized protein n=1 Tax=Sporobolomyces salmoneus TaxID=183962 RepID=UPI0031724E0B
MPKARSSLTGRVRKPPSSAAVLDPVVKKSSTTVVKKTSRKKPTVVLDLSDEEEQEKEEVVSEKKKGKRKAVGPEVVEEPEVPSSSSLKVHLFEFSTARSTVEKTWKPLSAGSKDELRELAKQVENEMKSRLPSGVSKSEFKSLVAKYMESLMKQFETLQVPPFPSTLKPRSASASTSTSKDSIDLLNPELVKKKIESTQKILEKDEKMIRELEEELEGLKRKRAEEDEEASALDQSYEEDERPISLPSKKKKKIVTIEASRRVFTSSGSPVLLDRCVLFSSSLQSDPVASPPPKPKPRSKKSKPLLVSTKPASKSILKPPRPPPVNSKSTEHVEGSDDFDSFPGVAHLPSRPSSKKTKSKERSKEKTTTQALTATGPKKRLSLAGKKIKT